MAVRNRKDMLLEAGLALSSELSLPIVLQRIVDLAVQVTDARYGALGIIDSDRRGLKQFVTTGISARERKAIGPLPQGRGVLGSLRTPPGRLPAAASPTRRGRSRKSRSAGGAGTTKER
jgi:GAF domain-containing protein